MVVVLFWKNGAQEKIGCTPLLEDPATFFADLGCLLLSRIAPSRRFFSVFGASLALFSGLPRERRCFGRRDDIRAAATNLASPLRR